MANKYANLVGTNKIKDEYSKINTGFDKVEADINNANSRITAVDNRVDRIITTPIDGRTAAQEVVDARAGFSTIGGRMTKIEEDIETHKAEFESHKAEYANHGNLKNKIINGNFAINQRRASTKAQPVGVYGYDMWKGHANGLEQVIEALPAGTYTLSWQGGGSGTFGGVTSASPITATVTAGNKSVIVPSTATKVQLEEGTYATPFEQRPIGVEMLLCQRYQVVPQNEWFARANVITTNAIYFDVPIPVELRTNPTVTGTLQVFTVNNVAQTGFTFSYSKRSNLSVLRVIATKTSHGLTDAVIRFFPENGIIIDANL